jgi:hypothetical protein
MCKSQTVSMDHVLCGDTLEDNDLDHHKDRNRIDPRKQVADLCLTIFGETGVDTFSIHI